MYSYHNRIKQRIENGECIGFEKEAKHATIKPCLMLYFNSEPFTRPVREHRFEMYDEIINKYDIKPI